MELLSVVTARAVYLLDINTLDPFGGYSAAEAAAEIKQRYGFAKVPMTLEPSGEKAAEFFSGRMGEIVIDKLALYPNGIVVDTRSSTKDAECVAEDIILFAREKLNSIAIVGRKHFVSQVTFRSKLQLANINPVLNDIAGEISESLSASLQQPCKFETIGVTVYLDPTQSALSPAKFLIERRADTPFFENTYFSSAPVHTELHLSFIQRFERSVM